MFGASQILTYNASGLFLNLIHRLNFRCLSSCIMFMCVNAAEILLRVQKIFTLQPEVELCRRSVLIKNSYLQIGEWNVVENIQWVAAASVCCC